MSAAALAIALQIEVCKNMKEISRLQLINQAKLEQADVLLHGKNGGNAKAARPHIEAVAREARYACREIYKW